MFPNLVSRSVCPPFCPARDLLFVRFPCVDGTDANLVVMPLCVAAYPILALSSSGKLPFLFSVNGSAHSHPSYLLQDGAGISTRGCVKTPRHSSAITREIGYRCLHMLLSSLGLPNMTSAQEGEKGVEECPKFAEEQYLGV